MIHETIDLWNEHYKLKNNMEQALNIKTYILSGTKKRGVVIICPGGGYDHLSPREAEPVALKFNAGGYHSIVLSYSILPRNHFQPLYDLAKAVCLVRENSTKWNIDPQRIVVCGFSAGGHLAASLGVFWNNKIMDNIPGVDKKMARPDGLILCYPVISSGRVGHEGSFTSLLGPNPPEELLSLFSLDKQVNKDVPPCFLWHTYTDGAVPVENSLLLANALKYHNIPLEFHIFPQGGHGISLATEETADNPDHIIPHASFWFPLCIEWLGLLN